MESIQAHPYLNVCAQYKYGLGKSDDISNLTIGGRQECWQKQPGEREGMNKEADSKKTAESVNELRGEKHKRQCKYHSAGRQTTLNCLQCFTCAFVFVAEKISKEMTLAIEF